MIVARTAVDEFTRTRGLRISVSHPHGNPNSYHAALALSEIGWLDRFETGILNGSTALRALRYLAPYADERARNRSFEEIPNSRKKTHRFFEMLSRAGGKLKPGGLTSEINWYDVLFSGHDFQVSGSLGNELDAVFAYEDAARRTFGAAKRAGATTVYELPLGYYKGVAREINRGREDWPGLQQVLYCEPRWKQLRKDAELDLADVIVVASDWARDSLSLSDGASDKPIVAVPYGTPAEEMSPRSQTTEGPFTALFAGQIGLRKGVPHLIEAWEKLNLSDARLLMAGSMNLPREYMSEHARSFEYLGALPRAELLELMAKVDLFVFPSLAEGFGLVIGEAMACGLPVLTTTNTGGPALITDGVEGWCVAAHEVQPLIERIEWAYQNRDRLYAMGRCARQRAEQWTWADYRRKLIAELRPYLGA
ncbi:MAG TPA: glycosyltransferase family 4 protein [Blastocatellia bacterium]|nr:glycosyltransferase family 4 protein [Blastocatellia bacterium]